MRARDAREGRAREARGMRAGAAVACGWRPPVGGSGTAGPGLRERSSRGTGTCPGMCPPAGPGRVPGCVPVRDWDVSRAVSWCGPGWAGTKPLLLAVLQSSRRWSLTVTFLPSPSRVLGKPNAVGTWSEGTSGQNQVPL